MPDIVASANVVSANLNVNDVRKQDSLTVSVTAARDCANT